MRLDYHVTRQTDNDIRLYSADRQYVIPTPYSLIRGVIHLN